MQKNKTNEKKQLKKENKNKKNSTSCVKRKKNL